MITILKIYEIIQGKQRKDETNLGGMFEDYRMLLMNWCNVVLLNCNGRKHRLNRTQMRKSCNITP